MTQPRKKAAKEKKKKQTQEQSAPPPELSAADKALRAHQSRILALLEGDSAERAEALALDENTTQKTVAAFHQGDVIVAVISSPKASEKIPVWEQHLSVGAVCLALVNAALASGWGANWLTGKMAYDGVFRRQMLGCTEGEAVAGFIHIGTETVTPQDRPRPDLEALTSWA